MILANENTNDVGMPVRSLFNHIISKERLGDQNHINTYLEFCCPCLSNKYCFVSLYTSLVMSP